MRLLLLAAAGLALALAKPGTYKEKEDFQFSRSSSDDGTKSGYYGAQRGNMGGNYERAHNMDSLAQNQMSGLVKQVEGELGDGSKTRTGSVYSAANSRGIYGTGHYDLSNLAGRNFQEGVSYDNTQSQSSVNSAYHQQSSSNLNSGYNRNQYETSGLSRGYHAAGYTGQGQSSNLQTQAAGYTGQAQYSNLQTQAAGYTGQAQYSNLQTEAANGENRGSSYNYDQSADQRTGYYSQSGNHRQSAYVNTNSGSTFGSNGHTRLISATPVRVIVRPGTRVAIPVAAQTYDDSILGYSSSNQNLHNSEAEVLSNTDQQTIYQVTTKPKHYESSYRYHKEWENHDSQPVAVPLATPTSKTLQKNSELYEDTQAYKTDGRFNSIGEDSLNTQSSRAYNGYNANSAASSQSQSRTDYNSQLQSLSSLNSNFNANGYNSGKSVDSTNQIGEFNSKPKSYESSYSYHKSWERQGDPYVIRPASGSGVYDGQASQRLTAASSNQGTYASHQYGSRYQQSQLRNINSGASDCDENGHIRVARSYGTQQALSYDENQQSQNNFEGLEEFGQRAQPLEDMGQQSQSQWDNLEEAGQQAQSTWDKEVDVGQQAQNKWDNLEDLGQQTQQKWDKTEDVGHQPQNKWDNLDNLGQQTQQIWDKPEEVGQQAQNQWDNLENLGQQTQQIWDKPEEAGQQTQNQWDKEADVGQQTQNKWDNLENLGQQTQQKWDKPEEVGQQTQTQWDKLEDLGQTNQKDLGPQDIWNNNGVRPQENDGQQTQSNWDNLSANNQQVQSFNGGQVTTTVTNIEPNNFHSFDSFAFQKESENKHETQVQSIWDKIGSLDENRTNYKNMRDMQEEQNQNWQQVFQIGNVEDNNMNIKSNHTDLFGKPQDEPKKPFQGQNDDDTQHVNSGAEINPNNQSINHFEFYQPQEQTGHPDSFNIIRQIDRSTEKPSPNNKPYANTDSSISSSSSSLGSLWGKIDNIVKEIKTDDTMKSSDNQFVFGATSSQHSYQNSYQTHNYNSESSQHSYFHSASETAQTYHDNNKINSSDIYQNNNNLGTHYISIQPWQPNVLDKNTTSTKRNNTDKKLRQQDTGRGDIGPEDMSSDEFSEIRPAHDENKFKTPEEIDSLSLTKEYNNSDNSPKVNDSVTINDKLNNTSTHLVGTDEIYQNDKNHRVENSIQQNLFEQNFRQQYSGQHNDNLNKNYDQQFNNDQQDEKINQQNVEQQFVGSGQEVEQQFDGFGQQDEQQSQHNIEQYAGFGQQHDNMDQKNTDDQLVDFGQQNKPNAEQELVDLVQQNENLSQISQGWSEHFEVPGQQLVIPWNHNESSNQNDEKHSTDNIPTEPVHEEIEIPLEIAHNSNNLGVIPAVNPKKSEVDIESPVDNPIKSEVDIESPPEEVTEKPGFWKSVGNKFTGAKDKVFSWFKKS